MSGVIDVRHRMSFVGHYACKYCKMSLFFQTYFLFFFAIDFRIPRPRIIRQLFILGRCLESSRTLFDKRTKNVDNVIEIFKVMNFFLPCGYDNLDDEIFNSIFHLTIFYLPKYDIFLWSCTKVQKTIKKQ